MNDFNSEKKRVLEEFEDVWLESDPELEKSDLQTAQELVLNPQRSSRKSECELFIRIRNALTPEECRDFSRTIWEFRAEKQQNKEMLAAANKRAKIENLKKIEYKKKKHELKKELQLRFETDFPNVDEFYRDNCAAYLSIDEFSNSKTEFVQNWAIKYLDAETSKLDSEQSAAVGAPSLDMQVIARAGSGKTTTIITRAYFLQRHCGVLPKELLLLAFNRDAADEMQKRLSSYLSNHTPQVLTFHALAYAVVQPEKILFDEPDGEQRQSAVLQGVIKEYLRSSKYQQQIRAIMMAHFRNDWDRIVRGGYDRAPGEMLRYRRSLTRESLDGRHLKSFGEKIIADFLFEHDISYNYEKSFWWKGVRYRPDFTVSATNRKPIVIEYFGLEGDPDYDIQTEQKRGYWRDNPESSLIEFNRSDLDVNCTDGFCALLRKKLESNGITCVRLSEEQIWARIKDRAIYRFTTVVTDFIRRCRKQSLTPEELSIKIHEHAPIDAIEKRFLDIANEFYASYLDRFEVTNLRNIGEEDFDGLIQKAVEIIASGKTTFVRKSGSGDLKQLRYVFIDEYQDFTPLFNRLIQGIRKQNPDVIFYCVGDDWQAINGFAGSELRFFSSFKESFPNSRMLQVSTNYRSSRSIVGFSNSIMVERGKPAKAHKKTDGKVLIVDISLFKPSPIEIEKLGEDEISSALLRIIYKELKSGLKVVLLSRKKTLPWYIAYKGQQQRSSDRGLDLFLNHIRLQLPEELAEKVTISTVHKYKGRQSDIVIVLDAIASCYPLIHPDWVFNRILGDNIERIVDEERRLFYVALTRAKQHLYLVTDSGQNSPFLDDLENRIVLKNINWKEYPPADFGQWHITVRVRNQKDRGTSPSFSIKDQLKRENFRWDGQKRSWYVVIPIQDSASRTIEDHINQSKWSKMGDGLEVRFSNNQEEVIAAYTVNSGKWSRMKGISI